jgi:hypothetical protein
LGADGQNRAGDEEANFSARLSKGGYGRDSMPQQFPRRWCPKNKLPSHAEKLRRQGIMMKDTAMVLLCYDMTRRRKDRVILELLIPKPGGHVLSPEFDQIRGRPRSRWA